MKKRMLIVGPLSSRSGYGDHARDLFHSFYNLNKFDIKVFDVRWGGCPRNALDEDTPKNKIIKDIIIDDIQKYGAQPDIYVDIRIPNEFQTIGKFNIGITAGIETTAVSGLWLEGCNKMDLIIVPSEHSKGSFVNSKFDKLQETPQGPQKLGELTLQKPMEVVFEGSDLDVFKPLKYDEIDSEFFDMLNETVPEKEAFLSVGQWVKGNYGEDRKDIARMIKIFYETFANESKKPALILKTSGATLSLLDKVDIKRKILQIKAAFPSNVKLPNVYLLHGDLSSEEMNYLYNHPKVKSLVTFTHGEGFGRPMLEATLVGLPVMASNWSGQVDFLSEDHSLLIGGKLDKVPQSAVWENIIVPESQWFTIDENQASHLFKFASQNHYDLKTKAKKLMKINREKFSHDSMTKKIGEIMDKYTSDMPENKALKLPKLKMMDSDDSPSVDMSQFDNALKKVGVEPNKYIEGVE